MALTANSYITPQAFGAGLVSFHGTTDATAALKALYVAGATNGGTNGSIVYSPIAVNSGATAHLVTLYVTNSGGTILAQITAVTVAASAGNNGTATPVALFSPANTPGLAVDTNGNPLYTLSNGETLAAAYATAQGTADILYVSCGGADF